MTLTYFESNLPLVFLKNLGDTSEDYLLLRRAISLPYFLDCWA